MGMRGLIFINGKDTGPFSGGLADAVTDVFMDIYNAYTDYAPFASSWLNRTAGIRDDYDTKEEQRNNQRKAMYMQGGYALMAEDLELIFHKKQTDAYNGIGGSGSVQTNDKNYRELRFKTQVSGRDPDLAPGTQKLIRERNFNVLDWGSSIWTSYWDNEAGQLFVRAFLEKRANFLHDLDDVEVRVWSSMFATMEAAYVTASKMTMQGGAEEAMFEIEIKEITGLTGAGNMNYNAWGVEPGVGL